ncbi:MAG TPA: hypothetical protein VF553_10320 [Pyrinomonadaceae bacterium]
MPLKIVGGHDTNSSVSPVAQTVPLADEGRATDGLAAEESQRLGEGTSRIRRAEMEELLKRVALEHASSPLANQSLAQTEAAAVEPAPVPTAALKIESASASPAEASSKGRFSRTRWRWASAALLCVVLASGLLAAILFRRAKTSASTPAPASGETQPVVVAEQSAPQIEPLVVETPPLMSAPSPAPTRARDVEAAAHPAARVPPTAIASASPAPTSETTQAALPPPLPPPPVLSASDHYQRGVELWATDRRAALEEFRAAASGVPDAYYYLGSEYYAEGRDPKTLGDGELKAALNFFLRATSGPHSGQASRAAQLLGKEYERRKRQSRP